MKNLPKIFLVLSLPLYVIDQITKWWAVSAFSEPMGNYTATLDDKIPVIDGFLWWWRIHNQGVAFGLGNGTTWAPLVFTLRAHPGHRSHHGVFGRREPLPTSPPGWQRRC